MEIGVGEKDLHTYKYVTWDMKVLGKLQMLRALRLFLVVSNAAGLTDRIKRPAPGIEVQVLQMYISLNHQIIPRCYR